MCYLFKHCFSSHIFLHGPAEKSNGDNIFQYIRHWTLLNLINLNLIVIQFSICHQHITLTNSLDLRREIHFTCHNNKISPCPFPNAYMIKGLTINKR